MVLHEKEEEVFWFYIEGINKIVTNNSIAIFIIETNNKTTNRINCY